MTDGARDGLGHGSGALPRGALASGPFRIGRWIASRPRALWKSGAKQLSAIDVRGLMLVLRGSALAWSAGLALLACALLVFAPQLGLAPEPYVVITAKSEQLRFRVVRPALARVALTNARVTARGFACDSGDTNITALLEPGQLSWVTYRISPQGVAIEVRQDTEANASSADGTLTSSQSESRLIFADESQCALPPIALFVMERKMGEGDAALDLPIVGPAELGAEMRAITIGPNGARPMTGLLRDGTVSIFGRSSWLSAPELYTVADNVMTLPAGGRLSAGDIDAEATALPAPWFGVASVTQAGIFSVSAATVSSDLEFYRPGPDREVQRLGLRLVTRVVNDPLLALLVIGLATFSFVLQSIGVLAQLNRKGG